MFGIASRYVKARRKAPAFHIPFFICKARALLLARRSLETSPNSTPRQPTANRGLRSLYFALQGIMDYFHYLKYALSGILTFIGIKMCVNELSSELGYSFHISNFTSLGVIVSFLTASILLSIVVKKRQEMKARR